MTDRSLLGRIFDHYAEWGALRTIGGVAEISGRGLSERCRWLAKISEKDRGKGYPLRLRIRAARHGLSAHSYQFLGLEHADIDRYVTSSEPFRELNREHITPVHNKYTFQLLTEPYVDALPELYGILDEGAFTTPLDPGRDEDLFDVLGRVGTLVLKPMTGGSGTGVHVLEQRGAEFLVDGRPTEADAVADLVAGLDEYVVTEFVRQHAYAEAIFPDATNTLRVYSIIDPDTGEPAVLRATHRFGSTTSAPTDNWSRGGYCAPVDVETGEIGRLNVADVPTRSKLDRHPDTGSRVHGVTVPHWEAVRELVREAANLHRLAPFVGWDVVVTEDGPVLLEANARASKDLLQIDGGILEDRRMRRLLGVDTDET